jgi:hypothetical protein
LNSKIKYKNHLHEVKNSKEANTGIEMNYENEIEQLTMVTKDTENANMYERDLAVRFTFKRSEVNLNCRYF